VSGSGGCVWSLEKKSGGEGLYGIWRRSRRRE